jgi:hypothetical protein
MSFHFLFTQILNTDSTYGKEKEKEAEKGKRKAKEEASSQLNKVTSAYLDYSFLDSFSFTAASLSGSSSQGIAQKQAIFLDDLKCMLRWSLPLT